MNLADIQIAFERNGVPFPVSFQESQKVLQDIRSISHANRESFISLAIDTRTKVFKNVQLQYERTKKLRDKFLKCIPDFTVEYI